MKIEGGIEEYMSLGDNIKNGRCAAQTLARLSDLAAAVPGASPRNDERKVSSSITGPGKPAGGARLTVDRVSVIYNTRRSIKPAIEDISLDISAGSFLSVLGPSGCGKTTLLKVIAGFVKPTTGAVFVNGNPVRGPGPDRAVVHQQTAALLPWLNVEDNVGLGLRVKGVPRSTYREIVRWYVDLVGLTEFGKHAVYELSGGMQQRVALARALAVESPIVLLDEPLGALDALQRGLMQDFLLNLWGKTRRTFFLITHSVEEAVYLSTDVLLMTRRPGRILTRSKFSFGREALDRGGMNVKGSPEFVKARAGLLNLLMSSDDNQGGNTK